MKTLLAFIMSLNFILTPVAHAGVADISEQVLSKASGIVGTNIILKCQLATTQPSLLVYMAGGIALVGKEIFTGKEQAEYHDDQAAQLAEVTDSVKDGGGDLQKESLIAQINDQKKVKDNINSHKKWMIAVTVIYTAATVVAIMEKFGILLGKADNANCSGGASPADGMLAKALAMAYTSGADVAKGNWQGAAMSAVMGGGGVDIGGSKYLSFLNPAVSATNKFVPALNEAVGRAIFFGASGVLAGIVAADLSNKEGKVQKNIVDSEKALAAFKKGTDDNNSMSTDTGTDPKKKEKTEAELKKAAIKALARAERLKTCASQGPSGVEFSSSSCSKKLTLAKVNTNFGGANLPTLTTAVNTATDFGQAVANGEMGKADALAGDLGAMAGRLTEVKKNLEKQLNDKLIAKGQKPIDFDKAVKDQVAALQAQLQKSSGASGSGLAASGAPSVSGENSAPVPVSPTTVGADETALAGEAPLSMGEEPIAEEPISDNTASLDDSLNHYESSEQDISKDKEASLFKQLSNRYLLNYTKIFSKKELVEEKTETKK